MTTEDLVQGYRDSTIPVILQGEISEFLDVYGMRGLAEIDVGVERWNDDPTHIIQTIQAYNSITDPEKAPDIVFKKGAESAEESIKKIIQETRQKKGWLKARYVKFLSHRLRNLAGLRESPKFYFVRIFGLIRDSLKNIGANLVNEGRLESVGDIFYLKLDELTIIDQIPENELKELVENRKKSYSFEMERRQIPRLITSDGQVYYDSPIESEDGGIIGSPVSPGTVEGIVHVMMDPLSEKLIQGEILVCPATDPSWTPLFLIASGLVMEVGGLMTHGSVVAREYGIPAIVGVKDATSRLKTGQLVRVEWGEKESLQSWKKKFNSCTDLSSPFSCSFKLSLL